MTNDNKTSEDLRNDAVNFVYGVLKFIKYASIAGILLVCWFIYYMSSVGH